MSVPQTVAEVLSKHVVLEVESIDRMYLNVYVPQLQAVEGTLKFIRIHRGHKVASTRMVEPITREFVGSIERFAKDNQIPLITFEKGQRKDDFAKQQRKKFSKREGVVFIGKAQEKCTVYRTEKRRNPSTKRTYPWIVKSTTLVNHYYFYCIDKDFGPFFLKFCSYFPYNAKLCLNGHEYLKQQLEQKGIAYQALENGVLSCDDPQALQGLCDRLSEGKIDALLRKWLRRLPHPFAPQDRQAGYRYQLSIARTLQFQWTVRLSGRDMSDRYAPPAEGAMQTQSEAVSGSEAVVRTGACIVGGGPAGLMLGLLLAKRGADVVVLEAHRTFDREFRGEVLQPSTARLLDQIGLLPYILEQPHLLLRDGRLLVNGQQKAGFSFGKIAPQYPYAIWMPQPIFLEALARKAAPYPGFHLWMGANVTEIVQDGGAVVGVRGLRDGKEPFTIRADVVVGADGRHSMVRKLGNFAIEYEHHDFEMIWFVVDPPPDWSRTIYFSVGTAPLLLLPKYPNQIQVGLVQRVGEWRDWIRKGTEAMWNHVGSLSPLFTNFAAELRDLRPFFPLPGVILMVREWAHDGLLLIGDAAHTMSPAGAIGVNVALSTAAVAAQEIFPRLGVGPIQKSALARVQALREEDIRTMHRLQRTAGSTLLGTGSGNPMIRWATPRLMALAIRVGLFPILQRRLSSVYLCRRSIRPSASGTRRAGPPPDA